jgi:hypothetical protein
VKNLATSISLATSLAFGSMALTDTLRIAHFNVGLERDGPGLLLDALHKGKDRQVLAVQKIIQHVQPDILVLNGFDSDADLVALKLFSDQLAAQNWIMAYSFSAEQNGGVDSLHDLNNDGYLGDKADAFGYADFQGQGGMAILSKHPILYPEIQDFTDFLWQDLSDPSWPIDSNNESFHSQAEKDILPLHSAGAWIIPVETPDGLLSIMMSHSTPPVFDGPEDANGKRNLDQMRFWSHVLDGRIGNVNGPFVLALGLNADPLDGEGANQTLRDFLASPKIADLEPTKTGDEHVDETSGHKTPSNQDTADWREPIPGDLRVDYVLPSHELKTTTSGVFWPSENSPEFEWLSQAQEGGTRHRLVWVDVELPQINQKP